MKKKDLEYLIIVLLFPVFAIVFTCKKTNLKLGLDKVKNVNFLYDTISGKICSKGVTWDSDHMNSISVFSAAKNEKYALNIHNYITNEDYNNLSIGDSIYIAGYSYRIEVFKKDTNYIIQMQNRTFNNLKQ